MATDRLQQMFDKQKALQLRIRGDELPAIMPERLPITVTAIIGEIGEILEAQQGWKDWRKNPPDVNTVTVNHKAEAILKAHGCYGEAQIVHENSQLLIGNVREEVVDAFHFLVNLALYCGMDANDLFDGFELKNQENHARQDRGY